MEKFQTWTDFLNFQGDFQQKILKAKNSHLGLINPESDRPL